MKTTKVNWGVTGPHFVMTTADEMVACVMCAAVQRDQRDHQDRSRASAGDGGLQMDVRRVSRHRLVSTQLLLPVCLHASILVVRQTVISIGGIGLCRTKCPPADQVHPRVFLNCAIVGAATWLPSWSWMSTWSTRSRSSRPHRRSPAVFHPRSPPRTISCNLFRG